MFYETLRENLYSTYYHAFCLLILRQILIEIHSVKFGIFANFPELFVLVHLD
jgi:hypothetical protein